MRNHSPAFNQILCAIAENLRAQQIHKSPSASGPRFQSLPKEAQAHVISRSRSQLEQMEILSPDIQEFEKFSILCRYHKVRPVADEVYTLLTDSVAWEIVDFGLNQLYRNQLVFKLGHYSIEEYETHSPWELFTRPQSILPVLMEITESLRAAKSLIPLQNIQTYIIEEALSEMKAQFQITHEFACPLEDIRTGKNKAFVSAFRLKEIPMNQKVVLLN